MMPSILATGIGQRITPPLWSSGVMLNLLSIPHPSKGEKTIGTCARSRKSRTEDDGGPRVSHAGDRTGLRSAEDGGGGHLRNRCQALRRAAIERSRDHGSREYRLHRQGRQRIYEEKGIPGRGSGVPGALRFVRPMRLVSSGPIPSLREYRLAL